MSSFSVHFWRITLLHSKFLVDNPSFSALNTPSGLHGFWWEISVQSFGESLHIIHCFFSCGFQESPSLASKSLMMVCLNMSLSFFYFIKLLRCIDSCFSSNWESFDNYFFKYSFCPFFLSSFLGLPLYSSDWIISIDLSSSWLIIFPACSKLCWAPLIIFKFQLLYFSTFDFLFVFLFIHFVTLLIFSIWWDIILTLAFSSLDMVSFNSFNIFRTFDLKSWLGTSPVVQWLRLHISTAGGRGSIHGWGAKISHTWQCVKNRKQKPRNKTLNCGLG